MPLSPRFSIFVSALAISLVAVTELSQTTAQTTAFPGSAFAPDGSIAQPNAYPPPGPLNPSGNAVPSDVAGFTTGTATTPLPASSPRSPTTGAFSGAADTFGTFSAASELFGTFSGATDSIATPAPTANDFGGFAPPVSSPSF